MKKLLPFLLAVLLLGCGRGERIDLAGSSTMLPIASEAAQVFSDQKGVQVTVSGGGSGVGIQKLGSDRVDIGMSSRAISPSEKERYEGTDFRVHVVAKDHLFPAVPKKLVADGVRSISMDELRGIYKGRIESWKALGGPDREILCVDKEASRGTRHTYMKVLFGDPKAQAPGADLVMGSNNEERSSIAQSDAAIGLLSAAFIKDELRSLKLIDEDGDTLSKNPGQLLGKEHPFERDLLFLTDGAPEGTLEAFIEFFDGEKGHTIIENAGYVPVQE